MSKHLASAAHCGMHLVKPCSLLLFQLDVTFLWSAPFALGMVLNLLEIHFNLVYLQGVKNAYFPKPC